MNFQLPPIIFRRLNEDKLTVLENTTRIVFSTISTVKFFVQIVNLKNNKTQKYFKLYKFLT